MALIQKKNNQTCWRCSIPSGLWLFTGLACYLLIYVLLWFTDHYISVPQVDSFSLDLPAEVQQASYDGRHEAVSITNASPIYGQHQTTIVTAYFEVPSKHSTEEYALWMQNMLSLQDAMVIFTEAKHEAKIRSLRAHAADRTVIIRSTLDALPVASMTSKKHTTPQAFWQDQLDKDPERSVHQSYKLLWIWLSKSYWVGQAIEKNFFSSEIFLWVDIGSFRYQAYNKKFLVRHSENIPTDSMLFMAFHKPKTKYPKDLIWFDKEKHRQYVLHSGSLSAGYADMWKIFSQKLLAVIQGYIDRDMFIGEDQTVMQSTCFQNPTLCTYVNSKEVRRNDNIFFGLRYAVHYGRTFETWQPSSNI